MRPLSPQQMADDLILCEKDPIHFIFNRLYTWDGETQSNRLFASGYPQAYQDKIKKLILDVIDVVRQGRKNINKPDFHILKSRQTGLTWTVAAIITYCFLFIPDFSAILTSQSDNKLDNSNYEDPNTFLGKINYMVAHLPLYLQPNKADILRSNKVYQFTAQRSSIKADSGISPARSTQVSLHAGDETAEQEFFNMKLSALREAVKGPNILFSTPNGMDNSFYTIYKHGLLDPDTSSFNFLTAHWKEKMNPEEWEAFRARKIKEYNGDMAMFNRNLELSFEGLMVGERVFNMFQDNHIIHEDDKLTKEIQAGNILIILDFGYYAPGLIISKTPTRSIIVSCILGLGKHPNEHSAMLKQEFKRLNLDITKARVYGDPSGVSKPREGTGFSSFELYGSGLSMNPNQRITIFPAVNKVIEGIQSVNGELFNNKLFVLDTCIQVIQGLKQAVYPTDETGHPIADKYILDHPFVDIVDTVRYGVMLSGKIDPNRKELFYSDEIGLGMGNISTGMQEYDGS